MSEKQKSPEQVAADLERIADLIWNAEFLVVLIGPHFDEGVRNPFDSDRCDPTIVRQPNRFMGFWGGVYNMYHDRNPHEGFAILARWRDRYFCQDDVRKRGKKKASEDETVFDRMPRCLFNTALIGNQLQRLGVPADEVMDALGNITTWQCSRTPPCCQKVTAVDRGFRFVIDDATKEAMPVKYVTHKPTDKPVEDVVVVDSDDEEFVAMQGGLIKNPFEVKLPKEERHKRQQRRLEQPRVIKLHPSTQPGRERFPDLFTGYALQPGDTPLPYLHPNGPSHDEQSPRRLPAPAPQAAAPPPTSEGDHSTGAPATIGSSTGGASGGSVQLLPMPHLPPSVIRCSHLMAHVMALDVGSQEANVGKFATVEPDRFNKEREQYYTALNKIFMADNHSALMRRSKYVTYNISFFIQPLATSATNATYGNHSGSVASEILPESLRDKLFSVYPKQSKVPVVNEKSEVVGAVHPAQAALLELRRGFLDTWFQGYRGWYYCSNQAARQTMQEPSHDTLIDVVHLPFPTEGPDALRLPERCRISVVCETVIDLQKYPPPEQTGGKNAANSNTNSTAAAQAIAAGMAPTRHVNTWQVIGEFQCGSLTDAEFKGKDVVEHVLLGREHHGIRIGAQKSCPQQVQYIKVQLPAPVELEVISSGSDATVVNGFVSHVTSRKGRRVLTPAEIAAEAAKERPPVPVPNHILCAACHDIARPFVLMSKPGQKKDEGFCHALLAARTKQVKAWEKLLTECVKSDTSKSIVMLELGCDKKADPARSYGEKTFKVLKQSKCAYVRIASMDLETKAKKGGEEGNAISLVTNPCQALVTIDTLLAERFRKGAR